MYRRRITMWDRRFRLSTYNHAYEEGEEPTQALRAVFVHCGFECDGTEKRGRYGSRNGTSYGLPYGHFDPLLDPCYTVFS